MLKIIRRHLAIKFFISYFIVIIIGIVVLITATEFTVPSAFDRHMAEMTEMMGPSASQLESDLYVNFNNAVNESLILSASAAFISAVIVSLFVSRQVVAPVRRIMVASQHIAEGHYEERVHIQGNPASDEMDELAQLSLSFNKMTLELEKAEDLRKQLIGDIAHELRTPLATIKGSMEGLMDGVLQGDDDTYNQVYQETERLQRLVNDLQDLNRVESGAVQIEPENHKVKDLIETTRSRLIRQFEDKGVSLDLDIPDDLPLVYVDADRIGQVLINIVGNSLQYTSPGGEVLISAQKQNDNILLNVTDSGIGISAENLTHVFTRFYRVDKSRSRAGGGSGIGLTIAKYLVESHGGKIWAESPGLGKGTTFKILLPSA
ncbi:MAG: ATP-binding protein [Anaerolineales bacterium]|nr:ATP-binding protein [Anaerolineales bacterium]